MIYEVILENQARNAELQIFDDMGVQMWLAANGATLAHEWAMRTETSLKQALHDNIVVLAIYEIIDPTDKELVYERERMCP